MELKWHLMTPTAEDFAFWIKNQYNVLFVGGHGIGKTTLVTQAFEALDLHYRYFSASTMDPWVDFIGVPKEQEDEKGHFLDLIKPKEFRDDTIEALFFDEYNRAPSKVQNAVMELIQFKSINGRKFDNLKIIWAAINSSEDNVEYNVESLDYAQIDRFHVIVKLPSKPQSSYFKKYGKNGEIICKWWDSLSDELKQFISPRRLDYILDVFNKGGDIQCCVPSNANVKTLISNLKEGLPYDRLKTLIDIGVADDIKKWLSSAKNLSQVEQEVISKHLNPCFVHLGMEKQSEWITKYTTVSTFVQKNSEDFPDLIRALRKSPAKKLQKWAMGLVLKDDSKIATVEIEKINWASGRALPNSKRQEINKFEGQTWDNTKVSAEMAKKITYSSELNSVLNRGILNAKPVEGYHTTYDRVKIIQNLTTLIEFNTLKIEKSKVKILLEALSYWTSGLQQGTLSKYLSGDKIKSLIKDLLAYFVIESGLPPKDFFLKYNQLYMIYDSYNLKWTKKI